jgi:hypothetical protein
VYHLGIVVAAIMVVAWRTVVAGGMVVAVVGIAEFTVETAH